MFFCDAVGKKGDCFLYQVQNQKTGFVKEIKRFHYNDWIDFGSICVEKLHARVQEVEKCFVNPSDLVWVHCLAGIGRTGSFITAIILKEKIEKKEITRHNIDDSLLNIIIRLRKQRDAGCVQGERQLNLLREYAYFLLGQ